MVCDTDQDEFHAIIIRLSIDPYYYHWQDWMPPTARILFGCSPSLSLYSQVTRAVDLDPSEVLKLVTADAAPALPIGKPMLLLIAQ